MITVTKAFIPDRDKYQRYVDNIFDSGQLTNNGPLLKELESRLANYLGVKNLILVANGSLALQVAYKALNLKGEVITSPFSFAATTSTLLWENLHPIFADINPATFNLDPKNIINNLSTNTSAILPVHVFGNPCEVEQIRQIADEYNLKVIYDASHAFGVDYLINSAEKTSVLNFGDISTISLHSTKLFHSIEGGAIITSDDDLAKRIRLLINFGISSPDTIDDVGTNAKMNEFEAAMGLCVLDEIENIKKLRSQIWNNYEVELKDFVEFQKWHPLSMNNHAYAPILLKNQSELLNLKNTLEENNIYPRRYFYPSLDDIEITKHCSNKTKSNSKLISEKILCLPIYPGLSEKDQLRICEIVLKTIKT